ncbi:hypothetical protein [Clavibacter michiganensis]|uniref:hypothetical protein n=2 Tax=Clavibacter michiganensis TaxID=28447 RepID=UPI000B8C93F7|nr:hypothetical protein [Clavibacter michiganensis]MBW8027314.1 hypothetical protein [Clavibacter michiganensis subsp. michiganensis]MDO4031078.1 hypothetical protein [Clavibacter michiganensis]MDO4080486.1 hypothetical protein [Clavibacter michiganensis]MDO4087373.1 hypothetical protein [Clavibacter michiganensis]MDO4095914.1 hypothetical protein [Clavibacter michiganensis]
MRAGAAWSGVARAAGAVALAATLALGAAGCTSVTLHDDGSPVDPGPSSGAATADGTTGGSEDAGTASPGATDDGAAAEPEPVADAASQAAALAAADEVMRTYAQPGITEAEWERQMTPLLSQQGAVAFVPTIPSRLTAHAVTGTGTVMPAPTAYALIVRVPTDDGDYDVALIRSSTTAPWLADEIQAVRDK